MVKRRTLPIQTQKCIGKYLTSHAKTFLTVSVPTTERTASELAFEQAPIEGGRKGRRASRDDVLSRFTRLIWCKSLCKSRITMLILGRPLRISTAHDFRIIIISAGMHISAYVYKT